MSNTTKDIEKICNDIRSTATNEIKKIIEVLNLKVENLKDLINDLSDSEKDMVMTNIINNLLDELKLVITIDKYREITRDVDEITDFYDSNKEDFDTVIEEGDSIANDLMFKAIGQNGRSLEQPLDIPSIKQYCLSSEIKKEQVYDALLWIIIRYIAILECVK